MLSTLWMLMYFFARFKKNLTPFMTKLRVLVLCFHYSMDNSNMSGFVKLRVIPRMITTFPIFLCLNYCAGCYPCHHIVLIRSVVNWCMQMRSRLQASINSWKFCQTRRLRLFTNFVRKIPSWRRSMPVYDAIVWNIRPLHV